MRGPRLFAVALVILCALPIVGNVPPQYFQQMAQFRIPLGGFDAAVYQYGYGRGSPDYFFELPQLPGPGLRAFFGTYDDYTLVNLGGGQLDAESIASTVTTPHRGNINAAFSPSGNALFVVGFFTNEVTAFSVDPATGNLSEAPGSPYGVGAAPSALAVDPTGRFLYVAHFLFDDEIDAFSIDPNTAELTPIATYPLPEGVTGLSVHLAASRGSLYVAGDKSAIGEFEIHRDGTLSFARYLDLQSDIPNKQLVVTPDGRLVYWSGKQCAYLSCDDLPASEPAIGGYITGPDGYGPFPTNVVRTNGEAFIAVHPTLPYLYAASGSQTGILQPLAYNQFQGEISGNGPEIEIDNGPNAIAVHPSGLALYVWSSSTGNLQSFSIDPANGRPSPIGAPVHLANAGVGVALAVQFLPRDAMAGVGVPYSQTIPVDGFGGPFDYSVSGDLPPGLALDASTGVISGTPTAAGTFGVLFRATGTADPERFVAERATTIQVLAATSAPTAPSGLEAEAVSGRSVLLSWAPGTGAADQRVEASLEGRPFDEWVDVAPPAGESMLVRGLSPASTYAFRVKAEGSGGTATSNTVTVKTPAEPEEPCHPGMHVACMLDGRFELHGVFQKRDGFTNVVNAFPITSDTSYLYFFDEANVEVVAKVLSGCSSNGHYWAFFGGLTNVALAMRVTDTQTGAFREYGNPASTAFAPIQDTSAFPCAPPAVVASERDPSAARLEAALAQIRAEMPELAETGARLGRPASSQNCTPDAETVCLNDGRFQVRATFSTSGPIPQSGAAQMVQLTNDTGYMWFFSEANVEVVVKVLSGCALTDPGHYWVFAGGLTNVQVTITVTDTHTGASQTYENPQGTAFQPIQDTDAFLCQ